MTEVKRVLEEATMLEMPILEKNLIALSTIAFYFHHGWSARNCYRYDSCVCRPCPRRVCRCRQSVPRYSEALFNTAGGISIGIAAIIAYNFFTTKIDGMTYMIDEASKNILENLETKID